MLERARGSGQRAGKAEGLPPEIAFLAGRVAQADLAAAAERAWQNGTAPHDELTDCGVLEPAVYAEALAEHLGLGFRPTLIGVVSAADLPDQAPEAAIQAGMMTLENGQRGAAVAAIARGPLVRRLIEAAHRIPPSAPRVFISASQPFIDALIARSGGELAFASTRTVEQVMPGLSARTRPNPWRKVAIMIFALAAALTAVAAPGPSLMALMIVSSVFFLGVSGLRLVAVAASPAPHRSALAPELPDSTLPIYSVLVPLYSEAHMVGPLIAALDRLDYPRAKLDIKLIVEADDVETQAELRGRRLAGCYEIVTVPDLLPKTKPKALNFALALSRGPLLTIFDAEDWPQPDQLRRAAAAFAAAPPDIACFQARLAWYNWTDNWLTRQFAIEYAALFDALLPALDRLGLPLPLGGTSNHFRRDALISVGAWDAWNVTEDADLGIRLTRAGYRCRVLSATTWEEAPNRLPDWLRQRTRWLKGWMQTYMVHMRRPQALLRALGWRGFIAFQLLIGGMVASALVHPLFFLLLAGQVVAGDVFLGFEGWLTSTLIGISAVNLVAGYGAGFALGALGLKRRPMRHLAGDLAWLPFYWLLISAAAYRALWDIVRRPFHWEKTEHGLSRTVSPLPRLSRRGGE